MEYDCCYYYLAVVIVIVIVSIVSSVNMSDQDYGKGPGGDVPDNAQDLTIFVQNLLEQMVGTCVFFIILLNMCMCTLVLT